MEVRKNYAAIDLAKFLLSFLVVTLHTMGAFGPFPFSRIAVPLFFMFSSFLYFSKNQEYNKDNFKKMIIRNTKLYLFWLLILLAPTLYFNGYLQGDVIHNLIKFVFKIFLGSAFPASWFLPALIISMFVIGQAKRFLNDKVILALGSIIYIACTLFAAYRGAFPENGIFVRVMSLYPGTIYNSFPIGLFWVSLGAFLANEKNYKLVKPKLSFALAVIFIVLVYVEYGIVDKVGFEVDNDCLFMMVPACVFLFMWIIQLDLNIKKETSVKLRNISTLVYCMHGTIARIFIFYGILDDTTFVRAISLFAVTSVICVTVSLIILNLEKLKAFRWLKITH